jgi:hypothetical protein
MKRVMAPLAIATCILLPSAGTAFSGQPGTNAGVNCGTPGATSTPGGSASAKGAPFNPMGTAGGVYANAFNGNPPSANSPLTATSQYDIACKNVTAQVTAHQPP